MPALFWNFSSLVFAYKPIISFPNPFFEGNPCLPAQVFKAGDIQTLDQGSVGPGGVEFEDALKIGQLFDEQGKFLYGAVFAGSHIHKAGGWITGQVRFYV